MNLSRKLSSFHSYITRTTLKSSKMSSDPKKMKIEDKDLNCRLRHGLNIYCLAQIFQYLDSADLYTVGGMNDFYKEIINDLIIPKHEVDFYKICERKITIAQVFERYGTNIQKFISGDIDEKNSLEQLIKSIGKYCSIDQLKDLKIYDTADLYKVGEMNEFYRQTIKDLVIPNYEVDFKNLHDNGITMSQMFKQYGQNIRKFYFRFSYDNNEYTTEKFLQLITHYCSADQLKCVEMYSSSFENIEHINLPIQFRKVEKLIYHGLDDGSKHLSVELSETLRCLSLANITLDPNFKWTTLKNIRELYLDSVRGINLQNFIEFIRHRPNLKVFGHDYDTLLDIGEAMAKYCGNQIQEYSTDMFRNRLTGRLLPQNFYHFVSGFKIVKRLRLTTDQICCGDLVDVMKQLAENNSIKELRIDYSELKRGAKSDVNCIFKERPNLDGMDMPHFSHLKSIMLVGPLFGVDSFHDKKVCIPFKLLSVYGPQILSNVEHLRITSKVHDFVFIKYALNLRCLSLKAIHEMKYNVASEILSNLKIILQKRNNEPNRSNSIHIDCWDAETLNLFDRINDSESITLSL